MALYKIRETDPGIVPFTLWDGETHTIHYNDYLITPPRLYQEELYNFDGFFYVPPPEDKLCLWAWFKTYHYPSWAFKIIMFKAETGEFDSQETVSFWGPNYCSGVEIGPDNWIYAARNETTRIYRLNWKDATRPDSWYVDPFSWTPPKVYKNVIVNMYDDLLVGIGSWYTDVWQQISTTPNMLYTYTNPDTTLDMGYESTSICWVLGSQNWIMKFNYQDCKVEMLSKIPAIVGDLGKLVAYDTLRQHVCVFRWITPNVDGSDASKIEFYWPTPKMYGITSPIPIAPIKVSEKIPFVSQVYGESGESFGGHRVNASLVAPYNHGRVISPTIVTDAGGDGRVLYEAPATEESEELKVSIEVPDTLEDLVG